MHAETDIAFMSAMLDAGQCCMLPIILIRATAGSADDIHFSNFATPDRAEAAAGNYLCMRKPTRRPYAVHGPDANLLVALIMPLCLSVLQHTELWRKCYLGDLLTWPPVSGSLPSSICCPLTRPCRLMRMMYKPSTRWSKKAETSCGLETCSS